MPRSIHHRPALALLAALLVCNVSLIAQGPAAHAKTKKADTTPRMEQVVQSYLSKHEFMGSVLVARDGKTLLNKGYGSANLEWKIPNSPTTKFRLGSLTKQFTAASILLLEERGKLSLDAPVKQYLPDAPAAWDKVTIFHLLTHTSGIPNFTSFPDYGPTEALETTPEKLVARFRDKPLDFQPGEKFSYSNSGYALLGYLIEKTSGQSYATFVKQNLFDPLGMKDSGTDSNAAILPNRASGYMPDSAGPKNAGFVHMSIPYAAGALYSTTGDLLLWEQGLFGGKLLKPASLQKMTTPSKGDYAFGLVVQTRNGRKLIEHNGGIEGFNTHLSYYPESKTTVVVLGNLNGGAPDAIAGQLGALAHGDKVLLASERKEAALKPTRLEGFVGRYQLAPEFILNITQEGDSLFAQATGQSKAQLFPEGDRAFFFKVVDAQITFEGDVNGKAAGLVLHQGGRDMPAKRMEGEVPAAAPAAHKEITVDPKLFDLYVGRYALTPTFTLTITREGDQLFAQATNQPKFELFPESPKEFFLKVVDAQVSFEVDLSGKATSLTLHQNGANMPAKRMD